MSAAIVLGYDLDVLVPYIPVCIFVLDANIWEVHLLVEVGQVVLTSPGCDLSVAPFRSAVAVVITAIAFLQKALEVAFQLAVQLNPLDARASIAQALGCLQVRPITLRVVAALAGPIGTGIELLAEARIAGEMSLEERASAAGKRDGSVLVIHRNALDEPLPFEVAEVAIPDINSRVTRVAQVMLGH